MKGKLSVLSVVLSMVLLVTAGCGSKSEETEADSFSVGRMEEQTYINEYFDIQYTIDDEWKVSGDEELVEAYNEVCKNLQEDIWLSSMDDAEVAEVVKKQDIEVPIMVAGGSTGSVMIYAGYEMTDPTGSDFYSAYMNEWMKEIKAAVSGPENENVKVYLDTALFQGKEIDCINCSYTRNGVCVYQKTVALYEGTYRISIMALSYVSFDDAQRMLDGFGTSTEPAVIESAVNLPEKAKTDTASYVVGSLADNVYTNEALGLKCELDDTWEFDSVEILQQEENMIYDDESVNAAMKQGQKICVMRARCPEFIVAVSIIKAEAVLNGGQLDGREEAFEASYEEMLNAQLPQLYEQFEIEKSIVEVMGEEAYSCFDISVSHEGEEFCQRNVFIKNNDFFGTITIKGKDKESVHTVLDCFSKYEP